MKKWILFALMMVLFAAGPARAGGNVQVKETEMFMHIGSPVALADGKLLSLDKDSPDLSPVIHQTRTMVPLRVIAEYFGAEVGYDPAKAQATINTGDHYAIFPVGKGYYVLDGVEKPLDVGSILIAGRAFVPLREICQETLGYTVDFKDGLIHIARDARLTDALAGEVKAKIGMYVRAASLEELKGYMGANAYRYDMDEVILFDVAGAPMPGTGVGIATGGVEGLSGGSASASAPSAAPTPPRTPVLVAEAAQPVQNESVSIVADMDAGAMSGESTVTGTANAAGAGSGYSATNIQVEGVDEGDIIKTDGKYIYIVAQNQLKIVDAQSMKLAGSYALDDYSFVREMYLDKDRVVMIGSRSEARRRSIEPGAPMADPAARGFYGYSSYTFVRVLDTSNPGNIKPLRYYEIEGELTASRKKGEYVYLVSSFHRWQWGSGDVRPMAGENGVLALMAVERIMIMPGGFGESFLTISAVNIRDGGEKVSSETIAGSGYTTYMSNNNLYLAVNDSRYHDRESMNIARFSIEGAKIGYVGSGSIEGGLNDQFSMDEYKGDLRVATSVRWPKAYNNLYIVDANMDVKGKVTGYAEGERIYSVRFMGERAYVVTFRQVDPLFVFDLSNPASPRITGELKVPGFSTYLHPVSQNVLLGVGRDVYDLYRDDGKGNRIVVGQQTGGVKISLFDVSDMGKPREIDTLILGDYGETELLYNHKAAMFKADEGLLGFCGSAGEEMGVKHFQGAFLVSYAGDKLSEAGRVEYENPYADYSKDSDLLYTGQRLIYIGDRLYYMQDGILRSFDLRTLTPGLSLRLTR